MYSEISSSPYTLMSLIVWRLIYNQDSSVSCAEKAVAETNHSLANLLSKPQNKRNESKQEAVITPYARFSKRLRHKGGKSETSNSEKEAIINDSAIIEYYNHLRTIRDNNGEISSSSYNRTICAARQFIQYTGLEFNGHAIKDLVEYKRNNPQSTDIEQALRAFSLEPPIKQHTGLASLILGIFRNNFTPLNLHVNNHFPPVEENCTEGIFREIYSHLTQEQQDLIQWGLYVPQRAKATYRIKFDSFDTTRTDYAVTWIEPTVGINKSRVKHPAFVPIEFYKRIRNNAQTAGRDEPFINHQSLWRAITKFAKDEYKIRLVSNYTRKFFEDKAEDSKLAPSIAAFLMGDKTKLARTGHLPLFYNNKLKFVEKMVEEYKQSGLENLLNLNNPQEQVSETERLKAEIEQLKRQLKERA